MNLIPLIALAVGLGCSDKGSSDDTGATTVDTDTVADDGAIDDTAITGSPSGPGGDDTDTGTKTVPCEVALEETEPEEGDVIFYRDPIELEFDGPGKGAVISLINADTKAEVALSAPLWDNKDTTADVLPAEALTGDSNYTLSVTICDVTTEVNFSTSSFGSPLTKGPATLNDRTYVVELSEVTYTEPAGLGFVLAGTLTVPILVGVQAVYKDTIDLIGAEGVLANEGYYFQNPNLDSWDFSGASWEDPFFSIDAESVSITYDDVEIPIFDFHLEGTFSPDGSAIGGGKLWGLGDTRNMSGFVASTDPAAICDLLALSGVNCDPCPSDDEPYCLYLKAEEIEADQEPDLIVVPIVTD